jgi:hypothetical protein
MEFITDQQIIEAVFNGMTEEGKRQLYKELQEEYQYAE